MFNRKERRIKEIKNQIKVMEELGKIYGCDPEFEPEAHPYTSWKMRKLKDELFILEHN